MKSLIKDLREVCSLKRSHGSLTEATYVASLAKRLNPTMIDGAGNLHFDRRGDHSRTLFVAHTDTVSRGEGANPIIVDGDWWCSAPNSTLGSDDGAGIALLLHLMRKKVPGYYVFCRAEEVGGQGSSYLAQVHGDLLEQFDRAIAFDRRGVSSVITHQGNARCCSDKFGEALANALSTDELLYATDNTGVFTDTANFTELVSECTNISCGYEKEHSDKERLNVKHLKMLAAQIVKVDWESLPTVRSCVVEEVSPYTWKDSQSWMREPKYDLFDECDDASLTTPAAVLYDNKKLAVELKRALELAEFGYNVELEDILSAERSSRVVVSKFSDSQYYIGELNSGMDVHEIIEDIYWSVR